MKISKYSPVINDYQVAIKNLEKADCDSTRSHILAVLNARDAVQVALKEEKSIPNNWLEKVIELDATLQKNAELITKIIGTQELANWRSSINPPAEAWWWSLEKIAPPHKWDRLDWLWKGLTVFGWTANLSLLVNIASRFLGGGVGLAGAATVILPSILTLLQASSQVTKAGEEGFDEFLNKIKIRQHFRQEAKLASTLMMSGILISLWLALPSISQLYNKDGVRNHYQDGKLGEAEQKYLRAISLDTDNVEAHFNLGNLYEDWQQFKKAKEQYQIAVAGDFPQAYNNLGRLYIRDKKYSRAASLLRQGLTLANQDKIDPEDRYSFLKNLGWVRFEQKRYSEAQGYLEGAISIANSPEAKDYIPNPGAAHCLLAQVLEKLQEQKKSTVLKSKTKQQWKKCLQLGSMVNPDEDEWLSLAKKRLQVVD